MKNKGILLRENAIIVDPTMLYDHVFIVFIKVQLVGGGYGRGEEWRKAYEEILDVNKDPRFEKPLRILFNIGGTGEYDFVAMVYTSDISKYHRFKAELAKRGIVEKFDSKKRWPISHLFFLTLIER